MTTKYFFPILVFVALFFGFMTLSHAHAQSLPKFVYLGGGDAGNHACASQLKTDPACQTIANPTNALNNLVVKKYGPARFELLTGNAAQEYTLGGSDGCFTPQTTDPCFVDEVWETNAVNAPTLERPRNDNPALVSVGHVSPNDGKGNKCVFEYVLIDDDGSTTVKEGFYITPQTWTANTLPNITYCPTAASTNNPLKPVHCSPGPTSQMVVESSFDVPSTGNLYIISEESIGYASSVTCKPVPVQEDKTDFSGFLWGIDPSSSSCKITATATQRSSCRLDEADLKNNVTLSFQVKDGSNNITIKTAPYNPNEDPPKYGVSDLLLDGKEVRVCVRMGDMVHPVDGTAGTYALASAKIGSFSTGFSGNCTSYFLPPTPNGNNNLHLGFTYAPPVAFDPPWFSTNNGDVFAGSTVVDRDSTTASIASGFTNNIVTQGVGSVLGHVDITPNSRYSIKGARVTNMVVAPTWKITLPDYTNLPANWLTTMPSGNNFASNVYAVSYSQFNNWLNPSSGTSPTSYDVTGTENLAVVYVHGNPASNVINFSRNLTSSGNKRLLIITDVPVTFTASSVFGADAITATGNPNIKAAIISTGGVSFIGGIGATPSDKSLLLQGLVATSGSGNSVLFGWDRGAANSFPATHVNFDPAYAWELADFDLDATSASGLTKVDLTWEVLD